jgi:hypothetical protein
MNLSMTNALKEDTQNKKLFYIHDFFFKKRMYLIKPKKKRKT